MTTTSTSQARQTGPLLAAGAHADVHEWADSAQEPRVVKIHRGPAQRRSALSEAAILSSLDHPHLVPLLDLAETPTGLGLVLPRLDPLSAEALVREREVITAGEAVTLVVPLLRALVHLERRRFHPGVTLAEGITWDNVLFDARGAPVLTALRPADSIVAVSPLAPVTVGDAARRLVREIVDVTVGGDEASRRLVSRLLLSGASPDELIEAVFGLEEAVPVERPDVGATVPQMISARDPSATRSGASADAETATVPLQSRVRAALVQVRPRVWLTSGVVMASVAIAAVALDGEAGDGPSSGSASSAEETDGAHATSGGDRAPGPSDRAPSASPPPSGPADDDVESTTRLLLAHREECLRSLDADCLTRVDRAGSPLARDDAAAVADPSLLATRPVAVELGEQTNAFDDTVLFDAVLRPGSSRNGNSEPASVLVVRTEAGWRLSDVR
ncbi:hypothetical protein AS850_08030 [Frondihabitans sp. 762G35]|uniref:protein kinase family protein n=1 Tax=Frondihabitans sp. 762G35 TaxID=1446794 RepID=UPI000D22BA74|nr:protein kinase family protein [Frondihabitans sp. 762G35]ARC57022.1 hypothetical protein AS850_08030 [Frondihabitans sp. 762G35]